MGAQKISSTASSPIGSKIRRRRASPATQAEKVAKRDRRKRQRALVSCLAVIFSVVAAGCIACRRGEPTKADYWRKRKSEIFSALPEKTPARRPRLVFTRECLAPSFRPSAWSRKRLAGAAWPRRGGLNGADRTGRACRPLAIKRCPARVPECPARCPAVAWPCPARYFRPQENATNLRFAL